MNRKILFFLILAFFAMGFNKEYSMSFFSSAYGEELVKQLEPLSIWPHEKSDLKPDSAIKFGRLDNGMRFILMKNNEPKNRVSMHLDVMVGSMNESGDERGIAHFLEHLVFCGSTHFPPGELVKYFQNIGMQFGADANAHTGFFETVYDILLPRGDEKHIKDALTVFKDYAEGAFLLQSEIDRERNVVLSEKRTRDSASYRTFKKTLKFEMPEALVSRRLPIGLKSTIDNAGHSLIKGFYDEWYRPENMVLVVVGDFDINRSSSWIKEQFENIHPRAKERALSPFGEIIHQPGIEVFYHHEGEAGNTSLTIETIEKELHEPDSYEFESRMLVKSIADKIVQNRLNLIVSKAETPLTSASISSGIYLRKIKSAEISAKCKPDQWENALPLLEQTLRKAIKYGFTSRELERVKKDYLAEMEEAVKSASTRKSQALARSIIWDINNDRVFQSPEEEMKIFGPVVKKLSVEQVNEAFRKTWASKSRLVLVTGNAEIEPDPEVKILETMKNSTNVEVVRPVVEKKLIFPYLVEPETKGKIVKTQYFKDLDLTSVDFQNKVRLNMKKTKFQTNGFVFSLSFGQGRSCEPINKPGLALLGAAVLNNSGYGRLTKEELDEALAGKNTRIRFRADEEKFVISGRSVSDELPLVFQMLYTYLLDPGYRKNAYKLMLEKFKEKELGLSHSIEGAMELKGRKFFAGNDTRFGWAGFDEMKKISLEDIKSWINKALINDPLELSIVGDFDPNLARSLCAEYLGSLPDNRTQLPALKRPNPVFPVGKNLELRVPTSISKAIVDLAYPTEDFWNISRTRRFVVLSQLFSEKMRQRLRVKLGATYSPYAYNKGSLAYKNYGAFHAVAYVAPEKVPFVAGEIKNIAKNIVNKGISDDEFKRVLDPILTELKDLRRSNAYWLESVLSGSRKHSSKLDWARTIIKDYSSIKKQEVEDLAKTYLVNAKAASVFILPDKKNVTHSAN